MISADTALVKLRYPLIALHLCWRVCPGWRQVPLNHVSCALHGDLPLILHIPLHLHGPQAPYQ